MFGETNGLGHAADPADPPDPVSSTAARAGGQDDGSYTKLPQTR